MVRIGGAVVIRHMAQIAGAAGQVVVVVDMALRALQVCMPVGQRETNRVVIETSRLPGRCVVAKLASSRKIRRNVIRARGLLIIRHVTTAARSRSALKLVIRVTRVAG